MMVSPSTTLVTRCNFGPCLWDALAEREKSVRKEIAKTVSKRNKEEAGRREDILPKTTFQASSG